MKFAKIKTLTILACFTLSFLISKVAYMQSGNNPSGTRSGAGLQDPLGVEGDFSEIGNRLITGALGTVGVLAIVAFIWGGIVWMTSGGSPDRIKKGKTMMLWAVIGLFIIFGSYAILNLIFTALGV